MMLTVAPSATGVFTPSRKRMSSSATNTLTKRRSSPASSNNRSWNPACFASRSLSTSATVAPSALISALPPDSSRSCVGMRTVTAINSLLVGSLADRVGRERLVEGVERWGDHRGGSDGRLDRVERLEPVAGDVGDHTLVGPDDPLGREPLQRGDGDAAGGLGEDALGAGEQLHRVDDLVVGDRGQ